MPHLHPHQENFIKKALEKLKQHAFKSTRARNDILEAIAKHDKALSAYELQELLGDHYLSGHRDAFRIRYSA